MNSVLSSLQYCSRAVRGSAAPALIAFIFGSFRALAPALAQEAAAAPAASPETRSPSPALTIGAYYYPWYEAPESRRGRNEDWMSKALRGRLEPRQLPKLGVYDSRDPAVIAEHIAQSKRGGIDFWAVSWWGPGGREDRVFRERILEHPGAAQLQYAVLYESTGRLGRLNAPNHENLLGDFAYLKERFFDHPHYLKIEGKPVVFLYLTRVYFRDRGQEALAELRRQHPEVYLIGDDVFGPRYSSDYARQWDAVTAYDVYGQSLQSDGATRTALKTLTSHYTNARDRAHAVGTAFVPAIAPGYNDRAVREGHVGRARYFSDAEDSREGDIFRAMIREAAVPLADPKCRNMIMVTSFNEWYEDTQIEATAGNAGTTAKDNSGAGAFYTEGDRYEDYGALYLDILREEKEAAEKPDGSSE
ncbi:MAG TPA: hypothetical protein VMN36_07975 [Verrucomicrobiales bacterium]|nr:hypothetical protein [Verrucomicrobiales bacterium]